jgi:hypothetical protein
VKRVYEFRSKHIALNQLVPCDVNDKSKIWRKKAPETGASMVNRVFMEQILCPNSVSLVITLKCGAQDITQ